MLDAMTTTGRHELGGINSWTERCKRQDRIRRLDPGLRCSMISSAVYEAVKNHDLSSMMDEIDSKVLPVSMFAHSPFKRNREFYRPLELLIKAEEAHQAIEMRKYDKFNYQLICEYEENSRKLKWVGIELKGLFEGKLLDPNDLIMLEDPSTRRIETIKIGRLMGDRVLLPKWQCKNVADAFFLKPLNVYFISSGLPFDSYERALLKSQGSSHSFDKIIFDQNESPIEHPDLTSIDDDEQFEGMNKIQEQAIKSILRAKCRPRPMILFGPPGTGKTQTLVEAAKQIYDHSIRKRILFCANSNTCADQIHQKLLKRFNLEDGGGSFSPIKRLVSGERADRAGSSRIIVTTNMKSAGLMRHNEFDYVFIDEAGHAHEPESLVPICSLKHYDGCLVLAGDPKQLGPVVQCKEADRRGLGKSMLERIFDFGVYQRDAETNKYDHRFITKLLLCYRCDPRILAISNELFYDKELECVNSTPASILSMMRLTNPVQLLPTKGDEFQPEWSTSWRNDLEAQQCVDLVIRLYLSGFSGDQIGIITPYKLQAREIKKRLKEAVRRYSELLDNRFLNWAEDSKLCENTSDLEVMLNDLLLEPFRSKGEPKAKKRCPMANNWVAKVDSVDAFQGEERHIIIISTVRSDPAKRLEFMNDSRRFNVACSRAKWLLLVVGNEDVLGAGKYWPVFLEAATRHEMQRWPALPGAGQENAHELAEHLYRSD